MDTNTNTQATIAWQAQSFLEKVMRQGGLSDPYDARDITEVIFRCMRDLMTTEAADRVAEELKGEDVLTNVSDKSLQVEVETLWRDTNPLVGFLSRVRPPLHGSGMWEFNADRFMFRVANESGIPRNVDVEQVIEAVFSATKAELSEARISDVSDWLPDGIRQLWQAA